MDKKLISIVAALRATDVKKTNDVSLAMTAKVSVVKCLLALLHHAQMAFITAKKLTSIAVLCALDATLVSFVTEIWTV
jgi:hypothetical protein